MGVVGGRRGDGEGLISRFIAASVASLAQRPCGPGVSSPDDHDRDGCPHHRRHRADPQGRSASTCPPTFDDGRGRAPAPQAEAGRRAAHLRPGRLRRGRRRPHHRPRPRVPRPLLGQPVRHELPPHQGQRPDPGQPRRARSSTARSRSTAPRSSSTPPSTRPDPTSSPPRTATACTARRSARSASRSTRSPRTRASSTSDHTRHHRAGRRRRVRDRGRPGARRALPHRQGRHPPEPRAVHRRPDASTRPSFWFLVDGPLAARRSCWRWPPARPS